MGSISHHITPLVIDSLGGGHTHKHTYRSSRTEAILRNQARVRPARAWFKKNAVSIKRMWYFASTPLSIRHEADLSAEIRVP